MNLILADSNELIRIGLRSILSNQKMNEYLKEALDNEM